MGKIVDLREIRKAVPMETVLAAYGIEVVRGRAICPFHRDHRPSMKVYPDGYYCFSCGNGGDAIKFVARIEHISNTAAALRVAEIGGLILPDDDYRGRERARRIASERRERQARISAAENEYRVSCGILHGLQRYADAEEPFGDAWCRTVRAIERLEVDLDGQFKRLAEYDAAGI